MSDKMKKKLGEELYSQVIEKMGEEKFDTLDDYIPKTRFNEVNEKTKLFGEKISSYEKQIKDTQEMLKGSEDLKLQYGKLQEQYTNDLQNKDKEINNILKKSLFKEDLAKNGAKHPDLLMKEVDWEKISIDNGQLIGATETITNIKTSYPDLFITKTTEGNNPKDTGTNNSGGDKWDFSKF